MAATIALAWLVVLAGAADASAALTTSSPEVKAAVEKGIKYLEGAIEDRLGGKALIGLVLVKEGRPPDHPKIVEAVKAIQAAAAKPAVTSDSVYSLGLSIIFMTELDPGKYRREIESLLRQLISLQQKAGGWGYPNASAGDTSMTQYGVLSMWEAGRAGFVTPADSWERVANWLLRTQDPGGAWGYQGTDPGKFELVKQYDTRHSMAAAGLGSIYICTDQMGLPAGATAAEKAGLPGALRPVEKATQRTRARVDSKLMSAARTRGDDWMKANYSVDPPMYKHYYLYALERYQSFREVLTGKPAVNPIWYDDGARSLISTQLPDGSWKGDHGPPDTCFALLFLVRSSQKSLKTRGLGDGTLVGGHGLPADDGEIEVRFGKVMAKPLSGPAEQLLSVIEDARNPDYLRAIKGLEELIAAADAPELGKQAKRLRELAGGNAPEAKAAALRALGRARNLDDAPLLIHALSDPEPAVFHAAEDGLRHMSRKFPPPGDPVNPDDAARQSAIKHWKAWYLSLRPTAILED